MADNLISLQQVSLRYPGQREWVLRGVDVSIAAGEQLAVTGVSGAGKTSLLYLLGLLLSPSCGEIRSQSQDLLALSEADKAHWRNENIGFVFQNFCLIPELTVQENVDLPLRMAGKSGEPFGNRLLTAVGLGSKAASYPHELSGGEIQRAAVARALANRPRLVLADEPTGNLDPETGRKIVRLLIDMTRDSDAALVLVTHDTALADMIEGRHYHLADGYLQNESGRGKDE